MSGVFCIAIFVVQNLKNMKLTISLAAMAISLFSFAQTTHVMQFKPKDGKHWGYMNQNGEELLPAKYSQCFAFSTDGYGVALIDKELKILTLDGKEISTEGSRLRPVATKVFHDGLLAVSAKSGKGFINTEGKVVIPLEYDKVTKFSGGLAVASKDDVWSILKSNGEATTITNVLVLNAKDPSEGLIPFQGSNKKWGFLDGEGKVAIDPQYSKISGFKNGLAAVRGTDDKMGFINQSGEWVIPTKFLSASDFDEESDLARVKDEVGWGYVDREGTVHRMNDTDIWKDFFSGRSKGRKADMFGFYGADMQWVIQPKYEAVQDFSNGYAAVRVNGLWGLVDRDGNEVLPATYGGLKDAVKLED